MCGRGSSSHVSQDPGPAVEITPGIAGGKPRIAGHRITVQIIVIWHQRLGKSANEIAAEYDFSLSDIYAALAYDFDHQAEIDREMKEGDAFVRSLRQSTPSRLRWKLSEHPASGMI